VKTTNRPVTEKTSGLAEPKSADVTAILRRFPYAVYFRVVGDDIVGNPFPVQGSGRPTRESGIEPENRAADDRAISWCTIPWVPEISRFFGIVVFMNYNDHPPPHFHVRYAEQKAIVGIESPTLLEGELSPRALGLVMEWAAAHRQELLEDWNLARQQQPLKRIAPLE
jgi:hypothetical protein